MKIGSAVVAALLVTGLAAGTANADPHPGQPFTVSPSAQHVFPVGLTALLRAAGYNAVRGSFSVPFAVSNATPSAGVISGGFPETPLGTGATTLPVTGAPQTFTAGGPGSVGFTLGVSFTESLEVRKGPAGTWALWSLNCTLRVTNPAQNRAFQPDVPIT
ncbi:hypothetical protein [Amycolatopsis sp. NPDC051371]|uniref:hypothetical protein n=1 Tax=Amycolatopsis sp. NPDC051371 TaxID=3155800 RepID=UPI003432B0DE